MIRRRGSAASRLKAGCGNPPKSPAQTKCLAASPQAAILPCFLWLLGDLWVRVLGPGVRPPWRRCGARPSLTQSARQSASITRNLLKQHFICLKQRISEHRHGPYGICRILHVFPRTVPTPLRCVGIDRNGTGGCLQGLWHGASLVAKKFGPEHGTLVLAVSLCMGQGLIREEPSLLKS